VYINNQFILSIWHTFELVLVLESIWRSNRVRESTRSYF